MSQQVGGGQAWKGWKRRKLGRARGGHPSTSGDGGCVAAGRLDTQCMGDWLVELIRRRQLGW